MLDEAEKSASDAGCGIGHGDHRAVARDVGESLPALAGKGIGVADNVIFAGFTLNRNHEVAVHGGWRKEDGRGTNPKAALDGKSRAARHGGQRLRDGAAQLKPRAAAKCRAATGNHAASDGETAAALGKTSSRNENKQK